MASHHSVVRPSALLIAVTSLAACQTQPALIYGERTSYNLAAIQVNDKVSEPVKINIGLFRSVVTVAPPRGGTAGPQTVNLIDVQGKATDVKTASGDAVSVFSNFDLAHLGNRKDVTLSPPLTTDDLNIRTRFASGQAAIAVSGNPRVAGAFLGLDVRTVGVDTRETVARKEALIKCVEDINDKDQLEAIAREFPRSIPVVIVPGSSQGTKDSITAAIAKLRGPEVETVSGFKQLKHCK